jgi:hypothetical protein
MKDGDALPMAKVKLMDGQNRCLLGVMTNMKGEYEFIDLEPGTYNVLAEDDEGNIKSRSVLVNGSWEFANFNFDEEVRYDPWPPIARFLPIIPYFNLSAVDIDHMKLDRNVLSMIASIEPRIYQADLGEPLMIRGSRDVSTTVLIDGVKQRGKIELPLSAIQGVNLYSIGMPAEFGDATGGVIAITTKAPCTPSEPEYYRRIFH